MSTPARSTSSFQRWTWLLWALVFLAIMVNALCFPTKHTTMPTYRLASLQWWAGQDPYTYRNHDGFLYLPQAAVLFSPFALVPFYLGEILWRALTFGLFLWALNRLADFSVCAKKEDYPRALFFLSLLAVPSSLASLRNAQFDLPLAALGILAADAVARSRWNSATLFLCIALALKPLAIVPLLLFGALYRTLIPRLIIGILIVALIPFLNLHPAFVAHEYRRCFETLLWATGANEPRYSDLAALLSRLGWNFSDSVENGARLIFALVYLGLGAVAVRRLARFEAAWAIGALAADYLMLFNPRTETCSYVFLAPFVASLALVYGREGRHRALSCFLGFAALGFACDALPFIHGLTDRWLKPLLALCFLPILVHFILSRPSFNSPPRQKPPLPE